MGNDSKGIYPKEPYDKGTGQGLSQCKPERDQPVYVRPELPGAVIVIHGVNDVGTAYGEVEAGLCEGLNRRLDQRGLIRPAQYRTFTAQDRDKLEEDPDAVFFKRQPTPDSYSPVIPFYWGFREKAGKTIEGKDLPHGQNTDRWGNRLDKDYSKGGGPFANATGTLPDMWNKGTVNSATSEWASRDPLRPLLSAPGRLYMVLAAQRLAALVSMIRDYHPDDTVSLVAHSQGCMLSLLAQAFLAQRGLRPADALVLTHPPYSLEAKLDLHIKLLVKPDKVDAADDRMSPSKDKDGKPSADQPDRYGFLEGRQTLHARLQTLANIVELVATRRGAAPAFEALKRHPGDIVGAKWEPTGDRDNRGKVYLYFCPEDMTVALKNVKGIGWQGVPEYLRGPQCDAAPPCPTPGNANPRLGMTEVLRRPFAELTRWNRAGPGGKFVSGFFQRVFTQRRRPDPDSGEAVLVGQARSHDHVLRMDGEDESDHAARMGLWHPVNKSAREGLPKADLRLWQVPASSRDTDESMARRRVGVVVVNGEPLPRPVVPDLNAGALAADDPRTPRDDPAGTWEGVDPIDAAIAATSKFGAREVWQLINDPQPGWTRMDAGMPLASPAPVLHKEAVAQESARRCQDIQFHLNKGKPGTQCTPAVLELYQCLSGRERRPNGKLLVKRLETPDEVRLHWQNDRAERSRHSAIFGSRLNHRDVTAFDLAIGQGRAVSDPKFRAYLCAVADWRLIKIDEGKKEKGRPGIMTWRGFLEQFGCYFDQENKWRKALIEGSSDYYSTGNIPECVALLPEELPPTVVCETSAGRRVEPVAMPKAGDACDANLSEWRFEDLDVVQPHRERMR
ncbi:T6SS effector phospholipase Tle3 domain-containing protein [Azohydromonas aeria]|uniref:T6SS effector phospholipase Tle3 domain-containing protein n=1 Tax=Azohydromonas aeria TaxID=2590212 RepID=UPI0012F92292|nr:DUF3274 domain-containing protein [Azohydromonas aeria]